MLTRLGQDADDGSEEDIGFCDGPPFGEIGLGVGCIIEVVKYLKASVDVVLGLCRCRRAAFSKGAWTVVVCGQPVLATPPCNPSQNCTFSVTLQVHYQPSQGRRAQTRRTVKFKAWFAPQTNMESAFSGPCPGQEAFRGDRAHYRRAGCEYVNSIFAK